MMKNCCAEAIGQSYSDFLNQRKGSDCPELAELLLALIDGYYPGAIDVFLRNHPKVLAGLPNYPIRRSASARVFVCALPPRFTFCFARKVRCGCNAESYVIVISAHLLKVFSIFSFLTLRRITEHCCDRSVKIQVHTTDPSVSTRVSELRSLVSALSSREWPSGARPDVLVSDFSEISVAGASWLIAHELAHAAEKDAWVPSSWTNYANPTYSKEELEADNAAFRTLMDRSMASFPLKVAQKVFKLGAGAELMLRVIEVVSNGMDEGLFAGLSETKEKRLLSPQRRIAEQNKMSEVMMRLHGHEYSVLIQPLRISIDEMISEINEEGATNNV